MTARYVTPDDPSEPRYVLYRLCECAACEGTGKIAHAQTRPDPIRCPGCRGEGRTRQEVASATDPESLGQAIVTCAREGEFIECPIGILDKQGETGQKWLVRPWQPSARNVSDAARTLAKSKGGKT